MLEKEMYLKKIFKRKVFIIFFFIFILINKAAFSEKNNYIKTVSDYIENIKEFSSPFIQIQNNEISEGFLFLKNQRMRIEYKSPNNIIFVLKKNKGMFFNVELEEVQYFNTNKTVGQIFFDIFYDKSFFFEFEFKKNLGGFNLSKNIDIDETNHKIVIYFEEMPIKLRKLEVITANSKTSFAITNPNYNPELDEKLFSLANPLL